MKTVYDKYPVFEANQVLSNLHLNQLFDYLGEQERLTRANLIGIGIVCGLEIEVDLAAGVIGLRKGCGVSSEGYLLIEPEDLALVAYRPYTLPLDLSYPSLRDSTQEGKPQYPLWELFPAGEPGTTALDSPTGFLDDKAVLLFLELKKSGLRNCSPNNCNDRGSEVIAAIRRLLIRREDLEHIIATATALGDNTMTTAEIEAALEQRFNLPNLRMPRLDVPNDHPVTSAQVLAAFHARLRKPGLAQQTAKALTAAYEAFKPLVSDRYPTDPFAGFFPAFGFLDTAPQTPAQVCFLQYYCDFFEDLIRAYDEMRWKGTALLCSCCPDETLFPRHLMLGVAKRTTVEKPFLYRQGFMASCAGESLVREFRQLFDRLVGMVESFTHQPAMAPIPEDSQTDTQIRITPSGQGHAAVAGRAIPYYYRQDTSRPLYQLWSPGNSERRRASHTLGYRSDEYTPAAPDFVTNPLAYDIEPYGFLRIEGHLGKGYQTALRTLLEQKSKYRLPVDIIALRTGVFNEHAAPDPSLDAAHFPDLEVLYDVLREALLTVLGEGIRHLYETPVSANIAGGTPRLALLKQRAPNFLYPANSVGAWYEKHLDRFQAAPYVDIDQNKVDANAVLTVYCFLFWGTTDLTEDKFAHVVSLYYLTKLSEVLPDSLDALKYAEFENKYEDLIGLVRYLRSEASKEVTPDLEKFIPKEDLIDFFDQVLYSCNLAPVKALHAQYQARIVDLKQKQYLGPYLAQNPGVQHKAGVPPGGTFILVYHTQDEKNLIAGIEGPDEAANAIHATLKSLAEGTVIADLFLPYLCCGGDAVQFVLPTPPLGLSVSLACTDANGTALASLQPEGGTKPYSYRVDDGPFLSLGGPVALSVGPHAITVRDSAGSKSDPQTLTVPAALHLDPETVTEDQGTMTYRVQFTITGGTPPYSVEPGEVAGSSYSSEPVPSGKALNVKLSDSAGCLLERSFNHEVTAPCTLPCDGYARRCDYRYWLLEPQDEVPYGVIKMEALRFEFEGPEGMIDLREKVTGILQARAMEVRNDSFDDIAQGWIKDINAVISDQVGTEDWLRLEYVHKGPRMPPILRIEHFECHKFTFHVVSSFRRGDRKDKIEVIQTPDQTAVLLRESHTKVDIPASNCERIAKCAPDRPVEALCKDANLKLKISKSQDGNLVMLNFTATGNDTTAAVLWEVQDGVPALSNEKEAAINLLSREPPIKNVRLSVFTEEGCVVVATSTIRLG